MKKITFLITVFLFLGYYMCTSQTVADTTKKEQSEMEKQIKTLNEKLETILKEKDSDYIGRLQLYNNNVPVYSKEKYENSSKTDKEATKEAVLTKSKDSSVIIDSVEISISDGVIDNLRVFSKSDIYENLYPIALQNFNKAILRVFIYNTKDNNSFLKITDFIQYLPKIGQNFLPDDIDFVLVNNSTRKQKALTAGVDLNSYIELQIYTDFLSLFKKEPNGLIQTEARTRFILNTVPTSRNAYFSNFMEASFKYSKFDSNFESLEINDASEPIYFNGRDRLLLNQYSFLNIGIKYNIIKLKLPRFSMESNVGLQYDLTDIKFNGSTDKTQIDLFSYYYEVKGGVFRSKNFGLNFGFTTLGQFITTRNISIVRPTTEGYFIPEFSAFYYPKSDKSNKVFLRFRTMTDFGTAQFINFQIGYNSKLTIKK